MIHQPRPFERVKLYTRSPDVFAGTLPSLPLVSLIQPSSFMRHVAIHRSLSGSFIWPALAEERAMIFVIYLMFPRSLHKEL